MDILSVLLRLRSRSIGLIIPDVVISEKHSDTLEITEHPVEKPTSNGSGFVADHAYRRPSELVMEVGFAGGGSLLDLLDTSRIGLSAGISPREIYEKLLKMQRERLPFDVVTGKRIYSNMLLRSLEVTSDKTTENVLSATLTLREVIITSTQTIQVAAKENMAMGVSTSAVKDSGLKSPQPANVSVLKSSGALNWLKGSTAGNAIGIQ